MNECKAPLGYYCRYYNAIQLGVKRQAVDPWRDAKTNCG